MGGGGGSPEEHEEGQIGSKRTQRWRRTRKRKFVQGAEMSWWRDVSCVCSFANYFQNEVSWCIRSWRTNNWHILSGPAPNISQRQAVVGDLRLEKNFLPEFFLPRLQILSDPAVKSRLILLARSCKNPVIISTLSTISQAFTPSKIPSDSVPTDMNAQKLTEGLLFKKDTKMKVKCLKNHPKHFSNNEKNQP